MIFAAIRDITGPRPYQRLAIAVLALTACATPAFAEGMICKNPGREYFLVYEQGDPAVVVNPDGGGSIWPVLSVLFDDRQHVVIADLGQPGMTAQVHFRPYRKVDIFSAGELVQTDACRS